MKIRSLLARFSIPGSGLLFIAAAFVASGCSKKAETATEPAAERAETSSARDTPVPAATPQLSPPVPPPTPPLATGMGQSDLAGAAGLAADQKAAGLTDAMNTQATGLLSTYSGELATLKSGLATVKQLIDTNAAMLPAGVATKYQELNAMMPRLASMVDSLKNYQSADLTTLVPKLKADFGTAQKLYAEIKSLLPQS